MSSIVIALIFSSTVVKGQSEYFKNWPAGSDPKELGKRLAENWAKRGFEFETGRRQFLIYPEVCTWYWALNVAEYTKDKDLQARLKTKFDRFLTADGAKNISPAEHVDYRVIGIVPLEIFQQTKEKRYLDFGKDLADKQWMKPTPDGITHEARYWIDDMYMITAVQMQAYRSTKTRSISSGLQRRWSPISTNCSSPTAFSITRRTLYSSGEEEMDGRRRE